MKQPQSSSVVTNYFVTIFRPCPNIYGVDSSDPKGNLKTCFFFYSRNVRKNKRFICAKKCLLALKRTVLKYLFLHIFSVWDQNVFKPAEELVSAFIQKRELDQCELKPLPHTSRTYTYEESRKIHRCEICDLVLRGQLVYEQHLKGRRHQAEVRKCRPHNSSKSFQNSESRFVQLSFPRHMVPNPIWEAVKVLRKMTRLPMHEIKSALERNHIDDDGQDEEQVISFRFCPSHIDAGNDKFLDDFKKHLATLGITEVNVNFVVE